MNPRDFLQARVWQVRLFVEHKHELPLDELHPDTLFDRLILEFRVPLAKPEKIRKTRWIGSFIVDVTQCGIRVLEQRTVVVAGWDAIERIQTTMIRLVDTLLTDVTVTSPGGDARLEFNNGLVLILFPARSQREECWRIESRKI